MSSGGRSLNDGRYWKRKMKSTLVFVLLCCACAVLPAAAQTAAAQTTAPEGAERKRDSAQPQEAERKRDSAQPQEMVLFPAGKFWMARAFAIYIDSGDLQARDKMDDRPANNVYLDRSEEHKSELQSHS